MTAHLHLRPRLRMSGAIPLHPQCAFMTWTNTTAPLERNNGGHKLQECLVFLFLVTMEAKLHTFYTTTLVISLGSFVL